MFTQICQWPRSPRGGHNRLILGKPLVKWQMAEQGSGEAKASPTRNVLFEHTEQPASGPWKAPGRQHRMEEHPCNQPLPGTQLSPLKKSGNYVHQGCGGRQGHSATLGQHGVCRAWGRCLRVEVSLASVSGRVPVAGRSMTWPNLPRSLEATRLGRWCFGRQSDVPQVPNPNTQQRTHARQGGRFLGGGAELSSRPCAFQLFVFQDCGGW